MTFILTPALIKKADGTAIPMIAFNDGTNNAFANALLDSTGALISPATSGLQTTANSSLATIVTNTTALSTAALQTTANTSLAAIASNTSGVSTAAKQDTGNTALASIVTNTTGGATSAKQDAGNTSLATIATNTTGAATSAKQDTANTALATLATNSAGAATAAKQDTGNASLASIATSVAAIATNTGTEATAAKQDTGNASLATIATAVQAALPAGANVIGKTGIDQTTPGTTNAVQTAKKKRVAGSTTTKVSGTAAYAFGNIISDNATGSSMTIGHIDFPGMLAGQTVVITGGDMVRSGTAQAGLETFNLHLYDTAAPAFGSSNGDHGAYSPVSAANERGILACTTDIHTSSSGCKGIMMPRRVDEIQLTLGDDGSGNGRAWYVLEARAALVPITNETFIPTVEYREYK